MTTKVHDIQSQSCTLLHITHQDIVLIVQTNQETSINSTHRLTLVLQFIQSCALQQNLLIMFTLNGRCDTAQWSQVHFLEKKKKRVQGLLVSKTSWHGCCIKAGFEFSFFQRKKVARAVPISLCYVRKCLPIWTLLCSRWKVKVRRQLQLLLRGTWTTVMLCMFTEGPCFKHIGSVRLTAISDKGTLASSQLTLSLATSTVHNITWKMNIVIVLYITKALTNISVSTLCSREN